MGETPADPLSPKALSPKALAMAFAKALGRDALTPLEQSLAAQAHEDYRKDELPGLTAADLACNLARALSFAAKRPPGAPKLRLSHMKGADGRGLGLDLLEILQDDAPFLVDSVMGELSEGGYHVKAMFHPVLAVGRTAAGSLSDKADPKRESLILVVMEPVGEDRRETLLEQLQVTLADVHAAVDDFPKMTALMRQSVAELRGSAAPPGRYGIEEYLDFLRWLTSDRFVFLGARIYDYARDEKGKYLREGPRFDEKGGLGVLRDANRWVLRQASEPAVLAEDAAAYFKTAEPLTVAKSNLRSRVHRRTYMDYVGVKRYGPNGEVYGEIRFVGLFTADAYDEPARTLPLVRRKVDHVLERAGENPSEHAEKRLRHIVESYPRDELFQIDEDQLLHAALGILHLYDRPRVRLFSRVDPFDRFVSSILYLPRDRYDSEVQQRAGQVLAKAWGGRISAFYPEFSDQPLARIHYIVGVSPGDHPRPDLKELEAELAETVRSWGDRLEQKLRAGAVDPSKVAGLLARYRGAFPLGYRDHNDADEVIADLAMLETLSPYDSFRVRAYRTATDPPTRMRIKLYREREPAPLAEVMPILEALGLRALGEEGYHLQRHGPAGPEPAWVHAFLVEDAYGEAFAFEEVKPALEETIDAVWEGRTESDGFNRLVIELGVSWREAALIRTLAKHRQQSGLDPSQAVQEASLRDHPGIARLILDLFRTKFDPAIAAPPEVRREQAEAVFAEITAALQGVASLDADRVLRRIALLVKALVRTNYYQTDAAGRHKPYISIKAAAQEIEELPRPRPYREVFVAAPNIEGVHLRFGPVARGGLRWSDRRDDFRTEVLGLVKAQQVKNAVIVPVGAKGGFYPKCLPRGGKPEEIRAEAVHAYKTFLAGLLDITDNLDKKGRVVRPEGVIAHDADDPYLVVAADKGTASFSDIANGVAEDYGFWLGDAFASGGSAGYDHKAMGITARGAWEAVKRHFRELGKDIQTQAFTAVGVGDMSGDVFGNGALLSPCMRLVAAFDHRHVFIDPDPDPEASHKERARLFALPRSSWDDYDKRLISKGGGVYSRQSKSIELSAEARAALGVEDEALAPEELIRAVLKAPVELLYLGGIGTYVKSPAESHADVGDKANDAVRVDGPEIRAQVVGEGANLGFTQAGRIAYARDGAGGGGGRINTDAIDNSAGVDTSDHEVNIKILTGVLERAGTLTRKKRDKLLASMTEDVAAHVLAHNYAQTLALSLSEADAATDLDAHAAFMTALVSAGRLDRRVEGLPGPAAILELKARGQGLTRPELAVLLAYGKLELSAALVATKAPDDPWFARTLKGYFPKGLAKYEKEMAAHPLKREIVSTVLSNHIVDMCGPTFPSRLTASLGVDAGACATAFEAAREIFGLNALWSAVGALDLKIPAAAQVALYREIASVLRGQTFWLAQRAGPGRATAGEGMAVAPLVATYREAAAELARASVLSPFETQKLAERTARLVEAGAPEDLARAVAAQRAQVMTVEIADVARAAKWPVVAAARLHHLVGGTFGYDRMRAAAAELPAADGYERQALRRLIGELVEAQTNVARQVMREAKPTDAPEKAVAAWLAPRRAAFDKAEATLAAIESGTEGWSFAKLSIAAGGLKALG
jgi:glutamate dehydrogenase